MSHLNRYIVQVGDIQSVIFFFLPFSIRLLQQLDHCSAVVIYSSPRMGL